MVYSFPFDAIDVKCANEGEHQCPAGVGALIRSAAQDTPAAASFVLRTPARYLVASPTR